MKLSQFNFALPKDLIASEPPRWRDECRLMVLHKDTGEIEHRIFKEIIEYFGKGDTFVLNDTKVFPARLYGKKEKTGADIEVFLLRELNREQRLWDVIVDPARKIRIGNKLYFGEDGSLVAEVIDNTTSRGRTLRFLYDGSYEDFKDTLFSLGEPPVPKWVKEKVTEEDKEDYQTIFAEHEGNRMVRLGDWKLVATHYTGQDWELYNIKEDRTEQNNLAPQYPEMVKELEAMYFQWAQRAHVEPFPQMWNKYNKKQFKIYKER